MFLILTFCLVSSASASASAFDYDHYFYPDVNDDVLEIPDEVQGNIPEEIGKKMCKFIPSYIIVFVLVDVVNQVHLMDKINLVCQITLFFVMWIVVVAWCMALPAICGYGKGRKDDKTEIKVPV